MTRSSFKPGPMTPSARVLPPAMQNIALNRIVEQKKKEEDAKQRRRVFEFSPSSPIKNKSQLDDKEKFIPYRTLNQKTYFKTIENVLANANNQTRSKFIKEGELREKEYQRKMAEKFQDNKEVEIQLT